MVLPNNNLRFFFLKLLLFKKILFEGENIGSCVRGEHVLLVVAPGQEGKVLGVIAHTSTILVMCGPMY